MTKYLLAAACLTLASCAAQKALPHLTEEQKRANEQSLSFWQPQPAPADTARHTKPPLNLLLPPVAAPDSLRFLEVSRKPNFLDKLFNHTPKTTVYVGNGPIKTGKKSNVTINNVGHSQSNTSSSTGKNGTSATGAGATSTQVEKPKGPVGTGTGDVTDQAGAGAASTIKGNNNAPVLTNTQAEAPDWKAQLADSLATPVGKVVAVMLVGLLAYGSYRLWPLLRRKSSTTNKA